MKMLKSSRWFGFGALIALVLGRALPDASTAWVDPFLGRPGDACLLVAVALLGCWLWQSRQSMVPLVSHSRSRTPAPEPQRLLAASLLATHLSLEQAIDGKLLEVVADTEGSATAIIQEVRALYDSSHKLVAYLDSSGLRGSTMENDISDCVAFLLDLGKFVHQLPDKMTRDMESVQSVVKEINDLSELVSSVQAIAMQSHLLAINAAIEGSHAGPSGAAFRVVATEMRTLASNSSDVASRINVGLARARNVVGNTMADSMSESSEQLQTVSAAGDSIARLQENFEDMRQFYKIRFSVITKYNEDLLQEIAEVLGHIQYQDVVSQCIQRIRVATAQRNAFFENAVQQYFKDPAELAQLPAELQQILDKFLSEEEKHLHSARHGEENGSDQKIELF